MDKTRVLLVCCALTACFAPPPMDAPAAETDGEAAETGAADPQSDGGDHDPPDSPPADDGGPMPDDDGGGNDSSGGDEDGYCGDGIIGPGEACDDTVNDGSYGGCTEDCSARGPYCGDGVASAAHGETCDDGNNTTGDGCNNDCLESGRELWRDIVDVGAVSEEGRSVDITPDGTVLVLARLSYDTGAGSWLRWYDPDGNELATHETSTIARSAAQLPNGSYAVVERSNAYSNTVVFYNDDHTEIWRHPDTELDANLVAVDHDDEVIYITGSDDAGAYYERRALGGVLEFQGRPSTGSCESVAAVPGDGAIVDCSQALYRLSPSGEVIFTTDDFYRVTARGDGSYATQADDEIRAFDPDGNLQWDLYVENGHFPAAAEDGTLVVAGGGWGDVEAFVLKLSEDGDAQWTRPLGGVDFSRPYDVDVSVEGIIVVTGFAYDGNAAGETDILTVAFAP